MIRFLSIFAFLFEVGYALVFFWILRTFLPLRNHRIVQLLAFVASVFFSVVPIYSDDLQNLVAVLLGFLVYVWVFHKGYWMEKLASVLVFYPAMIAVNFLILDISGRLFFRFTGAPGEMNFGWSQEVWLWSKVFYMLAQLIRLIFWVGAWIFLRNYLTRITANLTARMWLLVDALMLAPFVAVFTMVYFMEDNHLIVYAICGTAVFSSFGCMYLAFYICNSLQTAYRAQELEMQQAYYKDRIADEKMVRSIYHDMKNHLLVLQAQTKNSQELQKSVLELENQIREYEDYYHSGNEFLDIIIRDKSRVAREKEIDFNAAIQFQNGDFIEPLDISTIFGNSLDNAIEASEKLPADMRLITVKANVIRDMILISVENNADVEYKDTYRSTKKDLALHGFGLSNIKKAVEKYEGQCHFSHNSGTFTLKIMIPMPCSVVHGTV